MANLSSHVTLTLKLDRLFDRQTDRLISGSNRYTSLPPPNFTCKIQQGNHTIRYTAPPGAIFLTNITEVLGVPTTEIVSPYKDYETPTAFYSYNGYAVAMGRFDDSKALYYVSGAPKSRITGEIVFFREYVKGKLEYHQNKIVKGHLDFSGFGSSLLSLDLNNDDYDDLIVGAPYYYNRNINNASEPVEILSRSMSDLECQQLKCEHAQFGFSLTKLGDINQDGFQDFAVGAPYEGNGAVYIYHGSSSSIDRYVQRIEASSLIGFNLSSFGYSLSGGFDLDANGYPDLLVGAYESDTVALLRSRPIIKIKPLFSVKPEAVNLDVTPRTCEARPEIKDKLCVAVKMCLKFSTTPTTGNVFPSVTYKLEAEPQRRLSRVELLDAQDSSKKIIENKTVVLSLNRETCVTEVALLKVIKASF
ncbi:Integrin alpha-7 [Bulinus truncatus]|nr:Integrin alpha-7 [Bulinus truncatus]